MSDRSRNFPLASLGLRVLGACVLLLSLAANADPGHEQDKEEYVTSARTKTLLRDDLAAFPGQEVQILEIELPAGWKGGRHYHTGDVFVYVQEGRFVIDLDGHERMSFGPGEVYHEAVNETMQASNGLAGKTTRLLLFQVGNKGEPLMIKSE